MISLLIRFALIVVLAVAFAWLAERPGDITLRWLGYEIQTSLMAAVISISIIALVVWLIWSILLWVLDRPGAFGSWFKSRRQKKGREALSSGLIAVAAGDRQAAQENARKAVSILGDDPMVKLLDAQAAQLRGDSARVRELFEEMAGQPETRLLGLRGLHTEAVRQQDQPRARELAEQAARINPKVQWASQAVLSYQASSEDWPAIRRTIDDQKRAKLIDRKQADAKNAVVLTAQAQNLDTTDPAKAGDLALDAHKLDPSLVPAAVISAKAQAGSGNLRRASKIIERTWNQTPHPDLADVYAHIRPGDSAHDRLKRVAGLVKKSGGIEGAVALAIAAIEAQEWKQARKALEPYAHDRPQARVCGLMAEIEEGEFRDKGRAREWLARAVRAPRDPAWTADGFISRTWLPVSPVSGELGGFRWRVPVEGIGHTAPEPIPGSGPEDDDEPLPGDDAVAVTGTIEDVETARTDSDVSAPDEPDTETEEQTQQEEESVVKPQGDAAGQDDKQGAVTNTSTGDSSQDDALLEDEAEQVNEQVRQQAPTPGSVEETAGEFRSVRQPDDPGPDTTEKKAEKGWL